MASGIQLLNRATPGLKKTGMGTKMDQVISLINELRTTCQENRTAILEMIDDHATNVTLTDELISDVNSIGAAVDGICAKLDSDAGITDTDYAAIHATGGSGVAVPADPTAAAVDTLPT